MTATSTDWGFGSLTEVPSGRHWDPSTIRQQVRLREAVFLASGIEPGDRVLIHFGNNLEFFAELLAVWRLGGCAIPIDARLTPFEVDRLASASQAQFRVIDDSTPPAARSADSATVVRHTCDLPHATDSTDGRAHPAIWPRLDDDALILFTSGSTGDPKGVVHTHRSLLARWSALRQCLGLEAYHRTLCLLPTHFGHGLICNCLYPFLSGCDLYIAPPFRVELVMDLGAIIDNCEISFMSSVPSVWNLTLKTAKPPQRGVLKRIHVGSAPLSESNWTRIQHWAGTREVINAYGITETGSWVAGTTGEAIVPESGLIGQPWGAEIRVLEHFAGNEHPASSRICRPGETGMIWLHTPALMKGYFQRQDLTAAAVQRGWFKTGDIGLLDDRGRLFLRGRERDEINKGGLKIFPADIDEIVEQYPPALDVCTFGLVDEFYGENVGMAVVLDEPREENALGLHEWLVHHLAEHKHPAQWYMLDEIPRTSRGKLNRDLVRELCMGRVPFDLRQLLRAGGLGRS